MEVEMKMKTLTIVILLSTCCHFLVAVSAQGFNTNNRKGAGEAVSADMFEVAIIF